MKLIYQVEAIILAAFLMVLTGCGVSEGDGATSSGKSTSYQVGYDVGLSGQVGQLYFYGAADGAESACSQIYTMSVEGTTTDGIDWASIDEGQFMTGCYEGQLVAHPNGEWNN